MFKNIGHLSALETALERWRSDGVRLRPANEECAVVAAFSKTGRKVSRLGQEIKVADDTTL
ncbi:MAG TPA: hypothetical protein VGN90_12790 [Pyrinomonadaceae bacterium]|jgi:hypothetical protein|nr:hypothetical protein [Pyrinomonadaceae bacterium]